MAAGAGQPEPSVLCIILISRPFCPRRLFDVASNVWQWTTTPINGFEGFRVHPLYDDFSTPTFDGKHSIIKGGSWIFTSNEALK